MLDQGFLEGVETDPGLDHPGAQIAEHDLGVGQAAGGIDEVLGVVVVIALGEEVFDFYPVVLGVRMIPRSMMFSSSRMLPGQA
jgi:hypothetical protein